MLFCLDTWPIVLGTLLFLFLCSIAADENLFLPFPMDITEYLGGSNTLSGVLVYVKPLALWENQTSLSCDMC